MSRRANDDKMSMESRIEMSSLDPFRSITIHQDEDSQQGQAKQPMPTGAGRSRPSHKNRIQQPNSNEYAHIGKIKHYKHNKAGSETTTYRNTLLENQAAAAPGRRDLGNQLRPFAGR